MALGNIKHAKAVLKFYMNRKMHGIRVDDLPHMDHETHAIFDECLRECRFFLEFGSGGSTMSANRLQRRTISVESDKGYAKAVEARMGHSASVTIIKPDIGLTGPWGWPVFTKLTSHRLSKWRSYIDVPFELIQTLGVFPDFVLIDGRFRVACALETARRSTFSDQKPRILVDDYLDRPEYHTLPAYLGEPTYYGRSALFDLGAQEIRNIITDTIVSLACRNPD